MPRIANYARNVVFHPARVAYPRDERELRELVRGARKVRVLGSGHSWSEGIVTEDLLLSLDKMRRVLSVDPVGLTARVQGGIKLFELIRALEREGLAMVNLGSITEQSVAGALGTGTHGTGLRFACLASQVRSLRLVDGEGEIRSFSRGDPGFDAAAVGLGALGVVFEVELDVTPSFQLHAATQTAPFEEVLPRLDDFVRGYDHFKLWWFVPDPRAILFMNNRTAAPQDDSAARRFLMEEVLSVGLYRSMVALGSLHRRLLQPRINALLTAAIAPRDERTCKSYVGFRTPVPPLHRESEWAFDYAQAPELLRAYRELLLDLGYTFNFIQELRFAKADPFWLSPGYGRDSVWLSLYNIDGGSRWSAQRERFEAFCRAHGGRPHWGKEAVLDRAYLRAQYPRFEDFCSLRRELDPRGRFLNAWLSPLLS